MSNLPDRVQGGLRPAQGITWQREDGTAEDLTGATLTGKLRDRSTGTERAIAGTLSVTDGSAGAFRWDFAEADVADAGNFDVQFTAEFGAGVTPARTFIERWTVKEALG